MITLLTSPPQREQAYVTKAGDVVDALSFAYYGVEDSTHINALFVRNPKLAMYGPVLPAGVKLFFPVVVVAPSVAKLATIWAVTPTPSTGVAAGTVTAQSAAIAAAVSVVSPTQADIEQYLVVYRQQKAAGIVVVPPSPVFIPNYYASGADGISDPYIPNSDPVLTLV